MRVYFDALSSDPLLQHASRHEGGVLPGEHLARTTR